MKTEGQFFFQLRFLTSVGLPFCTGWMSSSVGGTDPISWDLQFPTLVGVDLAGARSPYVSVLMEWWCGSSFRFTYCVNCVWLRGAWDCEARTTFGCVLVRSRVRLWCSPSTSLTSHVSRAKPLKPKVAHTHVRDATDEFEDIAHDDSDDEGVDLAQLDSNATVLI